MPINYDKTIWVNDKTRLNESNLNHIEDGIEAVTNFANTLEEQMEHIPEFGIHVEEIDEKFYYKLDNQEDLIDIITNQYNSIIFRIENYEEKFIAKKEIIYNSEEPWSSDTKRVICNMTYYIQLPNINSYGNCLFSLGIGSTIIINIETGEIIERDEGYDFYQTPVPYYTDESNNLHLGQYQNIDGIDYINPRAIDIGDIQYRYEDWQGEPLEEPYWDVQMAKMFAGYSNENFFYTFNPYKDALITDVRDSTVDKVSIASVENIPSHQATATIVIDALTNLSGRYLSAWFASPTRIEIGGIDYDVILVKKGTVPGDDITEEEARQYMRYMTGSDFLPVYNYERPVNSLWVMADGSFWKPQWLPDFHAIALFALSNPFALKTEIPDDYVSTGNVDQTIQGVKTFQDKLQLARSTDTTSTTWGIYAYGNSGVDIKIGGNDQGTKISRTELRPLENNYQSLGAPSYNFLNLYLSGTYYFSNTNALATFKLAESEYGRIRLVSSVSGIDTERFEIHPNSNFIVNSNLFPRGNNSWDLGTDTQGWKDLYLSNSIVFSPNQTYYGKIRVESQGITLGTNVQDCLKLSGYGMYAVTTFSPNVNNQQSLGTSSNMWKDIYFAGDIYGSNSGNTNVYKNNSLVFRFQPNGFASCNYLIPVNDNGGDLGISSNKWRDIYLAGSFKDGTNAYSIAESYGIMFNPTEVGSTNEIKWTKMLSFTPSADTSYTFEAPKQGSLVEYKAIITGMGMNNINIQFVGVNHILCNDDNITVSGDTISLPPGTTVEISCMNANLVVINWAVS